MDLKAKKTVKNEDRELPGPFFLHKNRLKVEKTLDIRGKPTYYKNRPIVENNKQIKYLPKGGYINENI